MDLRTAIEDLRLVDQHAHPVLPGPIDPPEFERFLTESDRPPPAGTSQFDSQLGFALRRWCAPLFGLHAEVPADAYMHERNSWRETPPSAVLLSAAGCGRLLIDTGYAAAGSVGLADPRAPRQASVPAY